jgi:hypothetical protein
MESPNSNLLKTELSDLFSNCSFIIVPKMMSDARKLYTIFKPNTLTINKEYSRDLNDEIIYAGKLENWCLLEENFFWVYVIKDEHQEIVSYFVRKGRMIYFTDKLSLRHVLEHYCNVENKVINHIKSSHQLMDQCDSLLNSYNLFIDRETAKICKIKLDHTKMNITKEGSSVHLDFLYIRYDFTKLFNKLWVNRNIYSNRLMKFSDVYSKQNFDNVHNTGVGNDRDISHKNFNKALKECMDLKVFLDQGMPDVVDNNKYKLLEEIYRSYTIDEKRSLTKFLSKLQREYCRMFKVNLMNMMTKSKEIYDSFCQIYNDKILSSNIANFEGLAFGPDDDNFFEKSFISMIIDDIPNKFLDLLVKIGEVAFCFSVKNTKITIRTVDSSIPVISRKAEFLYNIKHKNLNTNRQVFDSELKIFYTLHKMISSGKTCPSLSRFFISTGIFISSYLHGCLKNGSLDIFNEIPEFFKDLDLLLGNINQDVLNKHESEVKYRKKRSFLKTTNTNSFHNDPIMLYIRFKQMMHEPMKEQLFLIDQLLSVNNDLYDRIYDYPFDSE